MTLQNNKKIKQHVLATIMLSVCTAEVSGVVHLEEVYLFHKHISL